MSPCSYLYHIQTTIPTLIAQLLLKACTPRDPTIPGLISISVPGTCKLDQGYSMPTMDRPVKDDQVWSLCLRHGQSWDRPTTRGLQSFQVAVRFNSTQALEGRLQATRNVESCLQVILPWSIVWLQCTRTWKSICFTVFSQRWQLTEARLSHLLRLVKVGSVSMLAFRANFRTP
jgi:hypothetical protein